MNRLCYHYFPHIDIPHTVRNKQQQPDGAGCDSLCDRLSLLSVSGSCGAGCDSLCDLLSLLSVSVSCVPPLRNRDMVVQRSWLDTGREYYILSHSVSHQRYPPRQGFVRALSHLAGEVGAVHAATYSCGCIYRFWAVVQWQQILKNDIIDARTRSAGHCTFVV